METISRAAGDSANLLLCVNRRVLPLLASCLRSVVRSGGYGHYDAYVIHRDFDDSQMQALGRDFQEDVTFHFLPAPQDLFDGFPESERYPREIYYRLAAHLLLPQTLERVLYLDVDLVVINSLRPLYETDFGTDLFVGCSHTRPFLTRLNQARLQSEKAVRYVNTGVLLLNLTRLRREVDLEQLRQYAVGHRYALILPDQDILTAMYGDRVQIADTLRFNLSDRILNFYNANHPQEKKDLDWVRRNTSIVHYCGKNKPWSGDYTGTLGVFYRELYEKSSGSPKRSAAKQVGFVE